MKTADDDEDDREASPLADAEIAHIESRIRYFSPSFRSQEDDMEGIARGVGEGLPGSKLLQAPPSKATPDRAKLLFE